MKHSEKHGARAKTIWCETCNESICNLCSQSQRHRDHVTMPLDTMKQFQIIRKKLSKTKTELKSKSVGLKTTIDGIEKTRDKLDSKKAEIKKKIDAGKSHDFETKNLSPSVTNSTLFCHNACHIMLELIYPSSACDDTHDTCVTVVVTRIH